MPHLPKGDNDGKDRRAGWTEEAANAPNENVYTKIHV
jgi:hypothetical protein